MKRKINKWENEGWTFQARQILNGIERFPKDNSIGMILRHSHRHEIVNPETSANVGLTPKGKEFAIYFGFSLPKNRPIRIYHSIVQRCRDTALGIQSGVEEVYQEESMKGKLRVLSDLNADGVFIAKEMMKNGGRGFLMKWKAGNYPLKKIMSFEEYYRKAAEEIWNHLDNSKDNSLNLYITHDLHITSLELGWFGLLPNRRWVSYLGGFAFSFTNDHILLLDRGKLKRLQYPHWWISKNSIIKEKGGEKNGKK